MGNDYRKGHKPHHSKVHAMNLIMELPGYAELPDDKKGLIDEQWELMKEKFEIVDGG